MTSIAISRKKKHDEKIEQNIFRDSDLLRYFGSYTKKHCIYECLIDMVYKSCDCVAPYFPGMFHNNAIYISICFHHFKEK